MEATESEDLTFSADRDLGGLDLLLLDVGPFQIVALQPPRLLYFLARRVKNDKSEFSLRL